MIFYNNKNQIVFIPEAMFTESGINKLIHDKNLFYNSLGVKMWLVYTLSTSLFYYELCIIHEISLFGLSNKILLYGIISIITFIIPPIKWLIITFLLSLFNCNEARRHFITFNIIYNFTAGIIVLPLLLITTYTKYIYIVYFALGLFLLNHLIHFIRAGIYGISYKKLSNIYFFIYLCILKILPVIIIILYTLR